ncbi:MAG: ion transporter [Armatimonadota bacterium]
MWEQVEHAIGEVFREARSPDLRVLSSASLEKLAASAGTTHEEIGRRILDKGEEQRQAAEQGDWPRFEACRQEIRRLQEEWLGLRDQVGHIEETLRRKRLDERVAERLGGRSRAVLLEAVILILIVAVLGMMAWEWLYGAGVSKDLLFALALIDTAICVVFLWEFFWKMSLADSAAWYFKRHWIDFVSSLPFALLHAGVVRIGRVARVVRVVRIARVARMARLMRLVRAVRAMAVVFRGFEKVGQSLNLRVLNRPLAATLVFLIAGGILMGAIEGHKFAGENEPSALAGIWWSFTTVCTGGFADIWDPETAWGRVLTVLLVILGAILTGAFTAALASVLLGDDTERIERKLAAVLERLDADDKPPGGSGGRGQP